MNKAYWVSKLTRRTLTLIAVIVWTAVLAMLYVLYWYQISASMMSLAETELRSAFQKDLVYRKWVSNNGGVYVPITETTPPNPHLVHLPEHKVTTTTGMELTLVNPAYMTRLVFELGQEQYGLQGHITSLNPLRTENKADPWEAESLKAFEKGVEEVFATRIIDGQPYLRLMRPFVTEESCLKCHAEQGYKEGDIRGGISVSTPLASYAAVARRQRLFASTAYGFTWLLGLLGLAISNRLMRNNETLLLQGRDTYKSLVTALPDVLIRFDRKGKILYVSDNIVSLSDLQPEQFIGNTHRGLRFPEAHCKFWEENLDKVFCASAWLENEFAFECKQGTRLINWRLVPESDEQGTVISVLAFGRDITAHRKAEQDYEMLFQRVQNGFAVHEIILDAAGNPVDYRFLTVNPAFERMTGKKSEDITGKTVREIFPDIEHYWIERYGRVALTGEPTFFEDYSSELKKHFEVTAFQTSPGQFACTFSDITDRKKSADALYNANQQMQHNQRSMVNLLEDMKEENEQRKQKEAELKAAEARFRLLFESLSDAVFIRTLDDHFILTNQAASDLLGHSQKELLGMGPMDIVGTQHKILRPHFLQKLEEDGAVLFESTLVHKDGTLVPIEVNSRRISYEGIPAVISIARNISERKAAESALRESEEKHRLLAENSIDIIWQIGLDATITYVSPSIDTLGYTPEEFTGTNLSAHCSPENMAFMASVITELIASKEKTVFEIELFHKNGHVIFVEIMGKAIFDENGKPVSLQGVTRDIRERKQAELEQQQLQEQLIQAQKMESVGRLAGGVAHDFNNMLGVILGNLEMALEQTEPGSTLYGDLDQARLAAKRSAELTRQLLTFARKEKSAPTLLNLNQTIGGMISMLEHLIGENIKLQWQAGEDLGQIRMAPTEANQIITNLCVNARDAITGSGEVVVSTKNSFLDGKFCANYPGLVPGNYVTLTVSDNGEGMDSNTIAYIFEPFFTTKKQGEGTGLGLATVYGIVKHNGGCLEIESEPGKGTTFKIHLPQSNMIDPELHITKEYSFSKTTEGSETVLLVEDEVGILRLCCAVLDKMGYTVLAAASPAEALRIAETYCRDIHLLVTDVIMPEMNGAELAQAVLALYPKLKCLYMSGYTADIIARHSALDENIRCIEKPFTPQKFATIVRETLTETC